MNSKLMRKLKMSAELDEEWENIERDIEMEVQEGFSEFNNFKDPTLRRLKIETPKRLHISNIPFCFKEDDIRDLFRPFGRVVDTEIIYNERGSKGFGFLTMANEAEANQACMALNGMRIGGRIIEVNSATERKLRSTPSTPSTPRTPSHNFSFDEGFTRGMNVAVALMNNANFRGHPQALSPMSPRVMPNFNNFADSLSCPYMMQDFALLSPPQTPEEALDYILRFNF